uniref:Uncharacterized protein n=1 Tax=viral metagenome TaxID=1070528 RepID=A0A6C0KKY2_9ZZZZ
MVLFLFFYKKKFQKVSKSFKKFQKSFKNM